MEHEAINPSQLGEMAKSLCYRECIIQSYRQYRDTLGKKGGDGQ
jgi:hypothetical protein